jgi:hypothetical protein
MTAEEPHKESPTLLEAHVVLDGMQQRYIPAYSNGVILPPLATRVLHIQIVYEGMDVEKPVLAALVDKGQGTYVLNFETVNITPKPPWPRGCLENDSAQSNFTSQLCFHCWLWFSYGCIPRQLRSPWPLLGGYSKNSDESPNTREKERVLSTFKHKVRARRDCDPLRRLHKFPKI